MKSALFVLLLGSQFSYAKADITPRKVPQGGVLRVRMDLAKSNYAIRFFGKETQAWPCLKKKTEVCALLPVPVDTKPGPYAVELVEGEAVKDKLKFTVVDAHFPKSKITVAKEMVEPSEEQKKRIADEAALIDQALQKAHATPYWSTSFIRPVNSKVTSVYGSSRVYNNHDIKTHLGVDMRANEKTKIRATNDATVLLAREFFLAGNMVLLDHGGGVISNYGHMSQIKVKEGEKIKRGTVLGFAGRSGRANGPHLHWGVRVQSVPVDGIAFLSIVNRARY